MAGIGPEGNSSGAPAPESAVAEPIVLTPEQADGLLSAYRGLVSEYDITLNWENVAVNNQPPLVRQRMHEDLVLMLGVERRVYEKFFRVMGIGDRARQVYDEVTSAESERRKQEVEALYGFRPAYVGTVGS